MGSRERSPKEFLAGRSGSADQRRGEFEVKWRHVRQALDIEDLRRERTVLSQFGAKKVRRVANAQGGERKGGDRDGKPRFDKNRDGNRFDKNRDRNRGGDRLFATSAAPRERNAPADPNSPFAKLAALKDQLGRKE